MDENVTALIQLQLWLDEELPELKQPLQDEEQDSQAMRAERGRSQAIQLYLPGCESE